MTITSQPMAHKLVETQKPQLERTPKPVTASYKEKIINTKAHLINSRFNKEMANSRQYFKQKKMQQALRIKLHAGPKNEYFI